MMPVKDQIKSNLTHRLSDIKSVAEKLLQGRSCSTELTAEIVRLQVLVEAALESAIALPERGYEKTFKKSLLAIPLERAIAQLDRMSVYSNSMEAALFHDRNGCQKSSDIS